MKDYYYFLGVPKDASPEDIKKAYRKLSLKYHPDKNEGDDFFSRRFQEIHEAYEILGNTENRKSYDGSSNFSVQSGRSHLPPVIKSFSSNKIRVQQGEEIIIKWNTTHADVVKVLPFGLEKPFGERSIKITKFQNGKFQLILHAHNSFTGKTAVKGLTIIQIFETDKEEFREDTEAYFEKSRKVNSRKTHKPIIGKLIIFIFILFVLYLITHLESFGLFPVAE